MKRIVVAFLLLSTAVLPSCKKDTASFTIGIDVQASFDQDNVQVIIDDQEIINRSLKTNHLLGVCLPDGVASTLRDEGRHEIKVTVNGTWTKTEIFSLHNNLYIGVNYDPQTNQIFFMYADQPFGYD